MFLKNLVKPVAILFLLGNIFSPKDVSAEIVQIEGIGLYPITKKSVHEDVIENAKNEAIRDALEKAGVSVFSHVEVSNNVVTKDVIKKTAGTILKILSDKYKYVEVDEDDAVGMYRATVVIEIDTDELNAELKKFLKLDSQEQMNISNQYKELQILADEQSRRIAELEKLLAEKNNIQNIEEIQNEVEKIDKSALFNKKIDEGWKEWENKNFSGAVKIFDEAVNLNPNNYQGYLGRGTSYEDLNNHSKAVADLIKTVQLNPNASVAHYNLGLAYYNIKDYSNSISSYNKAIQINKNYTSAYYNRGLAYYYSGNYEASIADNTKAIELEPSDARAYNNRGLCYEQLKKYDQALSDYKKAVELNPKSKAANQSKAAENNLKNLYKLLGKNSEDNSNSKKNLDKNISTVKEIAAVGEYIMSDIDSLEKARTMARENALRNAAEMAKIFVKSFAKNLSDDVIKATVMSSMKILSEKVVMTPIEGRMIKVIYTVTVEISV